MRDTAAKPLITLIYAAGIFVLPQSFASNVSGDFQLERTFSRHKNEQKSLTQSSLYLESGVAQGTSAFLVAYYDDEFNSLTLGLARPLYSAQVGVGIGQASYDGTHHLLVNPWLSYSDNGYKAYLHAEYYSDEADGPWWFKGYLLRQLGRYAMGLYGNSSFGVGLRLDAKIADQLSVWGAVPLALKPREGELSSMFGMSLSF